MHRWHFSLVIAALVACSAPNGAEQKAEAVRIANDYMKSKAMLDSRKRVTVEEDGDQWLVTYHVPDGYAGGDHRVWIDKRSSKVVASVGSQ